MTATMDYHTELIKLQQELRKVIYLHTMLKLKDKDSLIVSGQSSAFVDLRILSN